MKVPHVRRMLTQEPAAFAFLVTLWVVAWAAAPIAGLLLRAVFNHLAGGPISTELWGFVAALAAMEGVKVLVWYRVILARLEPRYTYRIRARLRGNALRDMLNRPPGEARLSSGEVVSRLSGDVDEAGVFAIWSAANVARLIVAVFAFAVMLSISVRVTVGLLFPIVTVMVLAGSLGSRVADYRAAARAAADTVSATVAGAVAGVAAIKSGSAEDRVVTRFRDLNVLRARAAVKESVFAGVQAALFENTGSFATGAVLITAAGAMRHGSFSVGDLALFVFYLGIVAESVWALGMMFVRRRAVSVSLERLAELAQTPDVVTARTPVYIGTDPTHAPAVAAGGEFHRLTAQELTFRYDGGGGIECVDLELTPSSVTVITGMVGVGKSTLLKAFLGIVTPTGGRVLCDGREISDPGTFFVPPRCSYTPQVPRLFTGTLRENVLLGAQRDDEDVVAAMIRAALAADRSEALAMLDDVVGPRGLRLSGGQVQRVAAARMLVRRSALMVFDDLSNGLDPATERRLWDTLLTAGRTTILCVSHRRYVLERADRVVVLNHGRVSAIGTADRLLRTSPIMREIWRREADAEQAAGSSL